METGIILFVTGIKIVVNQTDSWLYIQNHENWDNGRAYAVLSPRETTTEIDMWIPMCASANDFPQHHLEIGTWDNSGRPNSNRFVIWQHNRAFIDGDHVRRSRDGLWHDISNNWVDGDSSVDGNRKLTVLNFDSDTGVRLLRI
jgi:hypothetical protein